jgi:hypothetical protein
MDEQRAKANAAKAIGVMTGWAEDGADPSMALHVLGSYVSEGGVEELTAITVGLINVCGQLLAWRRAERGVDEAETLQELGRLYAGA